MSNQPFKAVNYLKMAVKNNPNNEFYPMMLESAEIKAKEINEKIKNLDKSKFIQSIKTHKSDD
jgi:hypothetical protein